LDFLVRQLLNEGFLLSVLGVAVGLPITAGLMRLLTQISLRFRSHSNCTSISTRAP